LILTGQITGRHSSGAVADRLKGNRKYDQMHWTNRLEQVFPQGEYAFPNWRAYLERGGFDLREPGSELPVRVITVPKTLKTPRIIAIEPSPMQFMQQGLLEAISENVGRDDILTHFISNEHQEPNQLLALEGSITGALATLDLKEASDRVSNQLVRRLLKNHSTFLGAVDACRSRKADVPGHGVIRLAKFASMGSALTFPFEAMIFLVIVLIGIEKELKRPLTKGYLKTLFGKVRIYGDDIIVPVDFVPSVYSELEAFGFRVNAGKSFWTGKFRESCGKEYYDGFDVSIVRCRSRLPAKRKDAIEFIHTASFRNRLFQAGYFKTCDWLDAEISNNFIWPLVCEDSPIIGRVEFGQYQTDRTSPHLHAPLVKGHVVSTKIPVSRLDDWPALMKFFLKRGDLPVFDRNHLLRSGRPVSVDIKTRWTSPF